MRFRSLCRFLVVATCLQSSLWVTDAWAQGDPLALQKSAIQRIENLISHYRKTGDYQPRHPDLATAETELAQSNRMLSARGDWSALSLGLIKKGTVYRMQSRWTEAIATYQQAHEAAKKAKHVNYQADALAWLALTEHSSHIEPDRLSFFNHIWNSVFSSTSSFW